MSGKIENINGYSEFDGDGQFNSDFGRLVSLSDIDIERVASWSEGISQCANSEDEILLDMILSFRSKLKWKKEAACEGEVDTFISPWDADHPEIVEPRLDRSFRVERAKKMCANCPVLRKCLTYYITHPGITMVDSVVGGTTDEERYPMTDGPVKESKRQTFIDRTIEALVEEFGGATQSKKSLTKSKRLPHRVK